MSLISLCVFDMYPRWMAKLVECLSLFLLRREFRNPHAEGNCLGEWEPWTMMAGCSALIIANGIDFESARQNDGCSGVWYGHLLVKERHWRKSVANEKSSSERIPYNILERSGSVGLTLYQMSHPLRYNCWWVLKQFAILNNSITEFSLAGEV